MPSARGLDALTAGGVERGTNARRGGAIEDVLQRSFRADGRRALGGAPAAGYPHADRAAAQARAESH